MKAVVISFAVYLIPIVGPHAAFLAGGLPLIHAKRDPLWGAADIASLLVLQLAIYFVLRRNMWLGLLTAPFAIFAANVWFSAILPAYFLIERDDKPIVGNQTAVCGVNDYWIEPVRSGAAWVTREQAPRYGLLDAGCNVKPAESGPGAEPPRSFRAADIEALELQLPMPSSWSLLSGDNGEYLLARNEREVWTARKNEPARLFAKLDFGLATMSFRRVGDGYVYWEGYSEAPRYRLAWKLAKGSGQIEVPKGRGITTVSVNPQGSLIAVSVSSTLNIGGRLDAVFVIDAATGQEVWRRTADVWRAEIAFVSNARLAVTLDRRVDVFSVAPAQ